MAIGIVTTIIGLALLGIFVLTSPISFEEPIDFMEKFLYQDYHWLSFIEIFAYFFSTFV